MTANLGEQVYTGLISTECHKCLRVEIRSIDDSQKGYRFCKPLKRFVIIETYEKTSPDDCPNKVIYAVE